MTSIRKINFIRSVFFSQVRKLTSSIQFILTFLIIFGNLNFSQIQAAEGNISENRIIELINIERTSNNLPSYRLNQRLTSSAVSKASDMIFNNYWAHISPAGIKPWSFISKAGYRYILAGENLANGYSSSEEVVAAWLNSSGHKLNIENRNFRDIGIGIIRGNLQGRNVILVVAHFGIRRTNSVI